MKKYWFAHLLCISFLSSTLNAVSSYTELYSFPQLSQHIAQDPYLFSQFKKLPQYRIVLEHLDYEVGSDYLHAIREQSPELLHKCDLFRANDILGNPVVYSYGDFGSFSPTTLRYIKVASDLK